MTRLNENFIELFQDFNIPIEVLQFVRDKFSTEAETDFCVMTK